MPYEWVVRNDQAPERSGAFCRAEGDAPAYQLHLWPYRSLPRKGFVVFIGATVAMLALPLIAMLGSPVLWGVLPFMALVVAGVWLGLSRSYRDGEVIEDLTLWQDKITLKREGPRGRRQEWDANPHWVRVEIHPKGGPVPNYLTLRGGARTVELGAFLSEPERLELQGELQRALATLR